MSSEPREILSWFQDWLAMQPMDWFKKGGVVIETLDNPGWLLLVDLTGTPLASRPPESTEKDLGSSDWFRCRFEGEKFRAAGDPTKLSELLRLFRVWVEDTELETSAAAEMMWLATWYGSQCNEQWEHCYGINI